MRRTRDVTGGDVAVAPLRRRDLRGVLAIERVSYPKPWTEGVFRTELSEARAGTRYYLSARTARQLVGYGGVMFVPDEAHVMNIAVAPSCRRSGVGRRLLAELMWTAIERGCDAVTLEVRESNAAAREMYERFGFERLGIRQRYYENVEDAIVMRVEQIRSDDYLARLGGLCREACR